MKKWTIGSPDERAVSMLQSQSGLSALCSSVLVAEGCVTLQAANDLIGCQELSSPFDICDMQEAADCINQAIDEGKKICVYGDYDCDGVMATAILYSFLHESGADVIWRLPERHEGYGLNKAVIEELHAQGVELIVTVDNGISAIPEAAYIAELGMELVITDHHQPGKSLPEAAAVVDPHREDNYSSFRLYCGAGIALMLVAALNDGDTEMAMEQFGDLAAIATIGDVVSLTGENRFIVEMGLQYLQNTERPGLRILREISSNSPKALTSTDVAFTLVPRINAAGRMESPSTALKLILEENPQKARELAECVQQLNTARRETEAEIMYQVLCQAEENMGALHERVLVFSGSGWDQGVIGIVASRLEERFEKPCFMISVQDGIGHGSARSFGNFSVFECLTECGELLMKYGGHPAAGGFTIAEENIPAFKAAVAEYAARCHPDMPDMEIKAAFSIQPEMLNVDEIASLSRLAPFGEGMPEPVFLLENAQVQTITAVGNGVHTKLSLLVHGTVQDAMLFRITPEQTGIRTGDVCHFLVRLGINTYMGRQSVSVVVLDHRPAGLNQNKLLSAMRTYEKYRRNEELSQPYYAAIFPNREECVSVYKAVPTGGISMKKLAMQMYMQNMNYCKMRICLDVFQELGLIAITDLESRVERIPAKSKVELQNSQILKKLSERIVK